MQEVDRRRRVSELIRRELADLLAREVADQRVKLASITAVTVSKDLKQATIYISSADPAAAPAELEHALNHAGKYLRYLLARRVNLRVTPGLRFQYDDSIRRGVEMTLLIDSLNPKPAAGAVTKSGEMGKPGEIGKPEKAE